MILTAAGIVASDVLPNAADLCASFQYLVLHHLAKRVQRALLYCELKQLLPANGPRSVVNIYCILSFSRNAAISRIFDHCLFSILLLGKLRHFFLCIIVVDDRARSTTSYN